MQRVNLTHYNKDEYNTTLQQQTHLGCCQQKLIYAGNLAAKALAPLITPPVLSAMIQNLVKRNKFRPISSYKKQNYSVLGETGAAGLVARTWLQ